MSEPSEVSAPHSDEEWKSHVKAEDAARDAAAAAQLPPASFESLVHLLAAQSMAALGLVKGPDGKTHKEPAIARHFIDLLAVLESKTQGQLTPAEHNGLDKVLHDLRMAYVAVTKGG